MTDLARDEIRERLLVTIHGRAPFQALQLMKTAVDAMRRPGEGEQKARQSMSVGCGPHCIDVFVTTGDEETEA